MFLELFFQPPARQHVSAEKHAADVLLAISAMVRIPHGELRNDRESANEKDGTSSSAPANQTSSRGNPMMAYVCPAARRRRLPSASGVFG